MGEETLGYVNLEWTCKGCGTKNPGDRKSCTGCGAPMSAQDQFELGAQQKLITDAAEAAKAAAGPDVACPYCGARNPGGSKACMQCGGDLTGAKAREAGGVLGAFQSGPVADIPCPFCGTPNPASAAKCKNCGGTLGKAPAARAPATPAPRSKAIPFTVGAILAAVIGACLLFAFLAFRTSDASAVVEAARWECSIAVQEQRAVTHDDWKDQIPVGAQRGTCSRRYKTTQSQPAGPDSQKVCGTPYVVDQGTGKGKVVQNCEYKVYDDWCNYTVNEWTDVDKVVAKGDDLNPHWPSLILRPGQREGQRSQDLVVTFKSGTAQYTYRPSNVTDFSKFTQGSGWTIQVNTFGAITGVKAK